MDSDSDDDGSGSQGGFDMTGILFGNIDSDGKLVDDVGNAFDPETKKHLASLSKFGLNSLLHEVIENGDRCGSEKSDEEDMQKDDDAVDYSDITEMSEDCPHSPPKVDLDDAIPANKVTADGLKVDDKELMPPPILPVRSTSISEGSKPGEVPDTDKNGEKQTEKKLDTPLAAILPSKYANIDVRELFPDFRPDKVLRFSRLFGPGKPSSLQQIWRSVKKRRRKRNQSRDQKNPNAGSDSTSDSEEPKKKGFGFHHAPAPSKEMCMSDDEDKLLRVSNSEDIRHEGTDSGDNNENKPKVAHWIYGPAQIWYDMLEVPDSGDGFNYGFKVRDKNAKVEPKEEEKEDIKGESIAMVVLLS